MESNIKEFVKELLAGALLVLLGWVWYWVLVTVGG